MIGELTRFFNASVEAVDNPSLFGTMFFVESKDIGSGLYIMDNEGLLVLFGEQNMLLKNFHLEVVGVFMEAVETSFAYGGYIRGFGLAVPSVIKR